MVTPPLNMKSYTFYFALQSYPPPNLNWQGQLLEKTERVISCFLSHILSPPLLTLPSAVSYLYTGDGEVDADAG